MLRDSGSNRTSFVAGWLTVHQDRTPAGGNLWRMTAYLVASPAAVPPSAAALRKALPPGTADDDPPADDPLWDALQVGTTHVAFTVGSAIPEKVLTWMPWAGRDLSPAARDLLAAPASTLRVDGPTPGAEAAARVAGVAARLALLCDGVLIDLAAQRFWGGDALRRRLQAPFDVRDYVSVHAEVGEDATLLLHTHGMVRFACPDLEMAGVPRDLLPFATQALNEVAHHQATGHDVRPFERVTVDDYAFGIVRSARSAAHCENDVLALVDPGDLGQRDAAAPRHVLAGFALDVAADLEREEQHAAALPWLDHAVALAPRRPEAWRRRAAACDRLGRAEEAQAARERADALTDPLG